MKKFVYRTSDGMLIKEYRNEQDLIQPDDCYVDTIKPQFGFDPDIYYGISTGIEKMKGDVKSCQQSKPL